MMTAMGYPTHYPDVSSDYILLPSSSSVLFLESLLSSRKEEAMGNN